MLSIEEIYMTDVEGINLYDANPLTDSRRLIFCLSPRGAVDASCTDGISVQWFYNIS
jgi:hypothetical protein